MLQSKKKYNKIRISVFLNLPPDHSILRYITLYHWANINPLSEVQQHYGTYMVRFYLAVISFSLTEAMELVFGALGPPTKYSL